MGTGLDYPWGLDPAKLRLYGSSTSCYNCS